MRSNFRTWIRGRILGIDLDIFRRDRQGAALRHGIAAVDGEVQQHLVKLRGVTQQWPQVRGSLGSDDDSFGKSLLSDFYDLFDQMRSEERRVGKECRSRW